MVGSAPSREVFKPESELQLPDIKKEVERRWKKTKRWQKPNKWVTEVRCFRDPNRLLKFLQPGLLLLLSGVALGFTKGNCMWENPASCHKCHNAIEHMSQRTLQVIQAGIPDSTLVLHHLTLLFPSSYVQQGYDPTRRKRIETSRVRIKR